MDKIETSTFNRFQEIKLKKKIKQRQSFLLLGPRQTGKSTLIEKIFSKIPDKQKLEYSLQLPSDRQKIETDPEIILRELEAKNQNKPLYIYIDEIQKVPQVMDVLQWIVDKKKATIVASGSSARKMRNMRTNWLPGRIHLERLYPLTWEEIHQTPQIKNLEQNLLWGALPAILIEKNLKKREQDLNSYVQLYLEEEIRMEAALRNLPRFIKFLQLAALESGSSPNYSIIASQVGVSHTTIREYFQILEDSLIIHKLPAFGKSHNAVLRTDRYYFFDMGVRNNAAKLGHSAGILTLQQGLLFEHWVFLELLAYLKTSSQFYYWRTKKNEEVDLVIEKQQKRFAIEIKTTQRPKAQDFKGLDAFRQQYPCYKSFLVCQIKTPQKFGKHLAVPWFEISERLR